MNLEEENKIKKKKDHLLIKKQADLKDIILKRRIYQSLMGKAVYMILLTRGHRLL